MTEGWICEGGHPYYLIDGVKTCWVCEQIAELGQKESGCKKGLHTNAIGNKNCVTCEKHRKRPWQKELDEKGVALCPEGHEVTHDNLKYSLSSCGAPQRKCRTCSDTAASHANSAYVLSRNEGRAAKGLPPYEPRQKKRLPPEYFDWVVALRLIEGKVDEVYDMRRGEHVGATAMEKWVAYHTTNDSYPFARKSGDREQVLRYQWPELGIRRKWKPKTLAQAMAEL